MKKRLLLTVVTFLLSSCSISSISSSNTSSSGNITSSTTSEEVSSSESSLEESSSISSSLETSSVGSSNSSDVPSSSVETPSSSSQASSSSSSSSIEVADLKEYDLEGFASSLVTSKDTLKVVEVRNAKEFSAALNNNKKDVVIDIKEDLNLGYEEVKKEFGTLAKITAAKTPVQHPILKETGVSKIGVEDRENIAIISTNGSSIKHALFNIKRCKNVIVRNIEFNELWEWDDVKDNSDLSKEQLNKHKQYNHKLVNQYDLNGNYIATYNSIRDATESCGRDRKSACIWAVLNNRQNTAYGYKWKYAD